MFFIYFFLLTATAFSALQRSVDDDGCVRYLRMFFFFFFSFCAFVCFRLVKGVYRVDKIYILVGSDPITSELSFFSYIATAPIS
jgi:hypothetical protein